MRFLNPTGLWLLLGIPILIIIYLIKAQHEERSVSSTFVWKLSERFAKKRLPFTRLRRIMLFILQLLMIILAAMMAAKPVIVKGQTYDYVAILDCSASMQNADEEGHTRFENALNAIEKQAKDLSDGHTMTVILAGDTASYLIEGSESTAEVKLALNKAQCLGGGCNTVEALALAQAACDRSDNAKVLFYTDCDYEKAGNIEVYNMSHGEWNLSLTALEAKEDEEKTVFTGSLVSYHKDAKVTVGLAIDGKTVDVKVVSLTKDEAGQVVFEREKLSGFDSAEIYVETDDSLKLDNRFAICRKNRSKHKVLLVSDSPLYLESALTALGNCQVTVVSCLEDQTLAGMDLYIFDGITPEEYPTDGSVLVFGGENLPNGLQSARYYEEHEKISLNIELQSELLQNVSLYGAVAKEYTALLGNRDWEYLAYCKNVPVAASCLRENGVRVTVFSFDLHDSNLPLMIDYPILMENILRCSIPSMIAKNDYTYGETVTVSLLPGMTQVYLQYPDNTIKQLYDADGKCEIRPTEIGVYTVVMKGEEIGNYSDFFLHIPLSESQPTVGTEINIAISENTEQEEQTEKEMAISGIWFWVAMVFLAILIIEWGWYYYEQY